MEKNPLSPSMVEVELYPVLTVNGNECERIVIGVEPMIVAWLQDDPPEHERVVVAMEESLAGVPEVVVQYAS